MIEYFKNLSNRAKIIWSISVVGVFAIAVATVLWLSQRQGTGTNFELKESSGVVATTTEQSTTIESSEKPSS